MVELDIAQQSLYLVSTLESKTYRLHIHVKKAWLRDAPSEALTPYVIAYKAWDRQGTKQKSHFAEGVEPVWNDVVFFFDDLAFDELLRIEVKAPATGRNHVFGHLEFNLRDIVHAKADGLEEDFNLVSDHQNNLRVRFVLDPPVKIDGTALYEATAAELIRRSSAKSEASIGNRNGGRDHAVARSAKPTHSRGPSINSSSQFTHNRNASLQFAHDQSTRIEDYVEEPAYVTTTDVSTCSVMLDNNMDWWTWQNDNICWEEPHHQHIMGERMRDCAIDELDFVLPPASSPHVKSRIRHTQTSFSDLGVDRRTMMAGRAKKIMDMSRRDMVRYPSRRDLGIDDTVRTRDDKYFFENHTYRTFIMQRQLRESIAEMPADVALAIGAREGQRRGRKLSRLVESPSQDGDSG